MFSLWRALWRSTTTASCNKSWNGRGISDYSWWTLDAAIMGIHLSFKALVILVMCFYVLVICYMHVYLFIKLYISRVKKLYWAYVYCFVPPTFKIKFTWLDLTWPTLTHSSHRFIFVTSFNDDKNYVPLNGWLTMLFGIRIAYRFNK